MGGTEKTFLGEEFSQPLARLNGQPNRVLIQSAETAELIHFAPPLTSVRQHGAKVRLNLDQRPMKSESSIMRFGNNDRS
jgi:hypothetical protein